MNRSPDSGTPQAIPRNRIQKCGLVRFQLSPQRIDAKAILVNRNTDNVKAVITKNLKGQKIAGFFNKYCFAGPGKYQ